jgi:sulfide:quinone oxidoreductase
MGTSEMGASFGSAYPAPGDRSMMAGYPTLSGPTVVELAEEQKTMLQPDATSTTQHESVRFEVLIAGAGVAGLEAAFAVRDLAGDGVHITVLTPGSDLVYRPNAVKEPFTLGFAQHYPLAALLEDTRAELVHDAIIRVDVDRRVAHTVAGLELPYDALLLGLGVSMAERYEHATTVDDARIDEHLHGLVQDVEEGYLKRLAFVIPAPIPWPLPAYELALLTAERAWDMQAELAVTILTPEPAPLAVFGSHASAEVAQLLADRGIEVITSAYCEIPKAKTINVSPGGRHLEFDRIVALPELRGPALEGIPHDGRGFIPVDEFCKVRGAERVYAAGDMTDFPVKHGGIAAQQADMAARSIAALAGAPVVPQAVDPVLEGVLVTGDQPRYFKAQLSGGHGSDQEVIGMPVTASTPKIAARYLAERLEHQTPARYRPTTGNR